MVTKSHAPETIKKLKTEDNSFKTIMPLTYWNGGKDFQLQNNGSKSNKSIKSGAALIMSETVNFMIYYKKQQNKFITSLKEAKSYYKVRNAFRKCSYYLVTEHK